VRFVLAVILTAVSAAAAAQAPPQGFQRSLWALVVNDAPKGETEALLRGDEVWIPVATLDAAGLRNFAGRRDLLMGQEHILIGSLAPAVSVRLDLAETVMYVSVAPQLLEETRFVLQLDRPEGLVQSRSTSAYLNYSATWDQATGVSGYGDAGLSLRGNISLGSDFSIDADGQTARGLSTLTIDRSSARQRWQIGDSIPRSTPLGSSPIMAGVSFGRDYSLDPYYYRYPAPTFRGTVRAQSDVDVYVNDVLVRRLQVAPGTYRLDRLPLTSGLGDVRIVLRDPLGRRQEIDTSVYLATGVLLKGEQDYEYVAGAVRDDSSGSPVYGDFGGVATHRVGVTDWFTIGASAEGSQNVLSGGPSMSVSVARLGEFEVHTSASLNSDDTTGYALYGIYTFMSRWLSIDALAQYYDPGYANLWQEPGDLDTPEYYQVSVGVPLLRTGSLTYSWEHERSPAGSFGLTLPDGSYDPTIVPSVSHSLRTALRVLPRVQLTADVTRSTVQGQRIWTGLAAINVVVGGSTTASVTHSRLPDAETAYVDINKPLPIGRGYGFRVSGTDTGDGTAYGELSVNTAYNQMRVAYDTGSGGELTNGSATISGGLIAAGGGFFFTRPLESAAAVVEVTGLPGVRIFADNVEVARTGRTGRALVPRLLPYLANRISFDEADIPFDYAVPTLSQLVAPPYRGAAFVKFTTARIQGRAGSVRMVIEGGDVVPAYGTLVVSLPSGPVESPLNAAGEFFLDLPDGRHQATVAFGGLSCVVEFDATSRAGELIQPLGLLRCTP
jgi:outer membrane usher protein